jgi:methionyl-tRNA synthetase
MNEPPYIPFYKPYGMSDEEYLYEIHLAEQKYAEWESKQETLKEFMKYDKYISTTLPYANSVPHIGHALEFIQADALARYFKKIKSETVFLNIGLDENGLKVHTKAQEFGIGTTEYLNSLCLDWTKFCQSFEINADNFYRTSKQPHHESVQRFWGKCFDRGDLYKKSYTGKYCTGCESFKTDADLINGKCPDHNIEPTLIEEENYFFRVEKYKTSLYNWFQSNKKGFLSPQSKIPELENFILNAEDISVSRLKKNVPWGIEVPNDPSQVIYVWFEALLNYIFAVNSYETQNFIQLCGPDNLRFQGSLFQSILESANLPHTKKLLVHGTVLDSTGKKISKSIGNVIDPIDQLNKYGLDAVRYYTLAGLTTYGNNNWNEKDLVQLYNTELGDDFGNLITRTLHLIDIKKVFISPDENFEYIGFGEWALPIPGEEAKKYNQEVCFKIDKIIELWEQFEINQALKETNSIIKLANKYINDSAPWKEGNEYVNVLNNLYFTIKIVNKLLTPILSKETILKIEAALLEKKKTIIFSKLTYKNTDENF